ncbi:MAG: CdaR family protein [Desulfotomaculaceae bacterium]|nr:CdaR family protein [Desulfotomaculaceae bacterium]
MQLNWHNNSIKLLSVLLALILWIYVSNEQNPAGEQVLTIGLEQTGLAQDLLITEGMPEFIRVRVVGNKNQLSNLTAGQFKAVIDLANVVVGQNTIPVQVSAPSSLHVSQVNPEEVHLSIDSLIEKKIPVSVSLQGNPAQGYTALAPRCQPENVSARGPGKVVNLINQVTAVVDISLAIKDITETIKVSASVEDVAIDPSVVRVVVPIVSTAISKTVPVKLQITGTPASGFTVLNSYSDPGSVQIFGPAEVINNVYEISTEMIDISNINKNFDINVGLSPITGIFDYQPGQVKVYIKVNNEKQTEETPNSNGSVPAEQ